MPKRTKVCRVCGKTYEACRSVRAAGSAFNWREVACSPECGARYFEQVAAARSGVPKPKKARAAHTKKTSSPRKAPAPEIAPWEDAPGEDAAD